MISLKNKISAIGIIVFLFTVTICLGTAHAGAPEPGKHYDKSNWQEIEEYLPHNLKGWLKQGKIGFEVSTLDFDFGKMDDPFLEKTRQNKGKYDHDEEGLLIDKATGELTTYVDGFPFPVIDPKDPDVAQKIMDNFQATREHQLIYMSTAQIDWLGSTGGSERNLFPGGHYFYYFNRLDGPVPNPNKFRKQDMTLILSPYDLRGTVSMGWEYLDLRENTSFSYLPMLRRVRRQSAAARSDPFMGSDGCVDDAGGWAGKNADMDWKYLGRKNIIVCLASDKKLPTRQLPDGTFEKTMMDIKMGYEVPGWKYASYMPAENVYWVVRPCYVVEGFHENPYYNYGKQIFYLDTDGYTIYYKIIYDRSGEYWKSVTVTYSYQGVPDNSWMCYSSECYLQVDDKTEHATVPRIIDYPNRNINFNTPYKEINPAFFTTANMVQLGK